MNKDFRLIVIILFAFMSIGIYSCETDGPECYEPVNITLKSYFVRRDSVTRTLDVGIDSLERDTIYIDAEDTSLISPRFTALDIEPAFYQVTGGNTNATNFIGVAFDPAKDSMRFSIKTDTTSALTDTVTFFYTTSLFFISNNCGYTNYYNLDSLRITKNVFDSAQISVRSVTKDGKARNILLFLQR